MKEVTIEEMQKKFEELPEDLKLAIMSADIDDNIIQIGKDQGLNVDQTGQLSLETHAVMFGYTHPDKFQESVKASLGLPDEKIKTVVDSVNEKILKNIREKLMELHNPVSDETKETAKETEILKSANIEITPEKPRIEIKLDAANEIENNNNNTQSNINDMISKIENPDLIKKEAPVVNTAPLIASQKLSGSFKIPATKTAYTLPSIGKNNINPVANTPPINIPDQKPKIDPYRELPE